MEKIINDLQLCLLNNKCPTYLHPASGSFSFIDLSLVHPTLYLDFKWTRSDDQYGSDHYPLIITSTNSVRNEERSYFKFNKADWDTFNRLCSEELTGANLDIESASVAENFSSKLHEIACQMYSDNQR